MKQLFMIILSLTIATGASACSPGDWSFLPEVARQPGDNENPAGGDNPGTDPTDSDPENRNITIKIGSATFTVTLTDNATASAFKALLPHTFSMSELNNNEKYCSLPQSLPTAVSNSSTIRSGDIMLYGSRPLVLFYKTFSTSYSYTRIGSVDNPDGLESALGTGEVAVSFEIDN